MIHLIEALLQGLLLSATLIVAIGAQNAFVLRQGLRAEHAGAVVVFCAGMDALLIALGVFGAGWMGERLPGLAAALRWGGAVFLFAYGLFALQRAWRGSAGLQAGQGAVLSRRAALTQAAAFTLLNPHVYLDTVLLVGSVGAAWGTDAQRAAFVLGAALASAAWFSLIGLGAPRLAPLLRRPRAWRWLDAGIGLLMLALALGLLLR